MHDIAANKVGSKYAMGCCFLNYSVFGSQCRFGQGALLRVAALEIP